MSDPLQLACSRVLGVLCGGAGYVLHVGQGVTGEADPKHGRPAFMWQVPNIDHLMAVVRGVDVLLPEGIENWSCVNNARDAHPLPLPSSGFWEGSHGAEGINKNYAAINGRDWRVIVTGVRSRAMVGLSTWHGRRARHVEAYDPARAYLGKRPRLVDVADLAVGQRTLPGARTRWRRISSGRYGDVYIAVGCGRRAGGAGGGVRAMRDHESAVLGIARLRRHESDRIRG
jgi:hypothetical protein